jgi:hypothetical protein
MSPTCSKRLFAGRNALSARDLTIVSSEPTAPVGPADPDAGRPAHGEGYLIAAAAATDNPQRPAGFGGAMRKIGMADAPIVRGMFRPPWRRAAPYPVSCGSAIAYGWD